MAQCENLFFSEAAEGSSNNKYLEIYNPTAAAVDLTGYAFPSVSNAPDNGVGNYDFWNTFPAGASVAAGDVYIIAHPSADPSILAVADLTFTFLSNGDDGFMLAIPPASSKSTQWVTGTAIPARDGMWLV